MPITIGSNISSLQAQRQLAKHADTIGEVFERLSTGMRINRASDDAAGLAIAQSLNADKRVFTQAIRNINDGLSLIAVADGALEQLTTIAVRLSELAEQSANGVFGPTQRKSLDAEAQALKNEYTRIIQSTEFNDRQLLTGEFGQLRVQAGYGLDGGIQSGLGGKAGTGRFTAAQTLTTVPTPSAVATGDLNGDGVSDLVNVGNGELAVFFGAGNGGFSGPVTYSVNGTPFSVAVGDLNGDGTLDLVTTDVGGDDGRILLNDGTGKFGTPIPIDLGIPTSVAITDFNGDGVADIVTTDVVFSEARVVLGGGNGTFGESSRLATGLSPISVTTGDFNGDGANDFVTTSIDSNTVSLHLGNGSGGFGSPTAFATGASPFSIATGDFNGDGKLDLVTADRDANTVSLMLGDGRGGFSPRVSFGTGGSPNFVATADFNSDGFLDVATADSAEGTVSILLGDGAGNLGMRITTAVGADPRFLTVGDFNGDGVVDIASSNQGSDSLSILLATTRTGTAPLLDFSLLTIADARQALTQFGQKIDQLTSQRAEVGAFQSRLSTSARVLLGTTENIAAAESRIRDADVAFEAGQAIRLSILQSAASSVLAQANQQPSLALTLLANR